MIITRLRGGLGNQMFQYAAGLRLARKLDMPFRLDLSWLKGFDLMRIYSLPRFQTEAIAATEGELRRYCGPLLPFPISSKVYYQYHFRVEPKLRKRFDRREPLERSVVVEPHFHFEPRVLDIRHSCLLDGFWQCENYFSDVRGELLRHFTPKNEPTGENKRLIDEMAAGDSVFIHVRRGDYVSNSRINQVHGACREEYYEAAMQHFEASLGNPRFYFFSDEPDWVEVNLARGRPATVVRHNGTDADFEDIRLMASCKHGVIANSSFSWWGAWLNPRSDKQVVAPRRWFRSDEFNDQDVVPKSWLRM